MSNKDVEIVLYFILLPVWLELSYFISEAPRLISSKFRLRLVWEIPSTEN
jgi:hypothetical protein